MLLIQPLGDGGRRLKVQCCPQLYAKCEPGLQEILREEAGIKKPSPYFTENILGLRTDKLRFFCERKSIAVMRNGCGGEYKNGRGKSLKINHSLCIKLTQILKEIL